MSCLGHLTPMQREALAASSPSGPPLSRFASPPVTEGKRRRLRLLAGADRPGLRESAANSASAPVEVLETLADDPATAVRAAVARNPVTPSAVLARLAADPDVRVRGWVAVHRRTAPAVLDRLRGDPDPVVRALADRSTDCQTRNLSGI